MPLAQFYLTDVGKAAALDAEANSIDIQITHLAVGTAKYDGQAAAPAKTSLTTEIARYGVAGGGVNGQVLRLLAIFTPNITANVFEVGLFLADGTLFAIAAVTGVDPLLLLANGLTNVVTHGVSLADIGSNITVSVDANSPLAVSLISQHIAHGDPHPQYLMSSELPASLDGKYDKTGGLISGDVEIESSHGLATNILSGALDAIKGVSTQFNLAANGHIKFQHIPDTLNPATDGYHSVTSSSNVDFYEFDKPIHAPSFVGGNVSIAENGYTSLPNGLIMQWGRGLIINNGYIAFPIAFPNSLLNVQVTDDGPNSIRHGYNWDLSDNTRFNCTTEYYYTLKFSYIALGY